MAHDCLKIGREKEKQVAEVLVSYGLIKAYWMPPRAKFFDQDVFGVYDILALGAYGECCGIQVCRKRPGEIGVRKAKLEGFAKRLEPSIRSFIAYYGKDGFWLEELMPSFTWRFVGVLPWQTP